MVLGVGFVGGFQEKLLGRYNYLGLNRDEPLTVGF